MRPPFIHEAEFRQERNFGAKIGATLEFIGSHWRPLLRCLFYFVLPPALLMGIGLGIFTNQAWNQAAAGLGKSRPVPPQFDSLGALGGIGLLLVGSMVAYLLLTSVVYGYLRARLALAPTEPVTTRVVWDLIRPRLGRLLGAWLLLTLLGLGAFGGLGALLFQLGPGYPVLLFFPALYVMMPLALFLPVFWFEDQSPLAALRRCFYLIRGKWWSTLGLLMVIGLIQGTVSMVFILPQYAIMFGKLFKIAVLSSDVLGIAVQCLYTVGLMLTYTLPLVALAFQYFNLVERHDGVGLHQLVDRLGQTPGRVANAAYQPEDEGEY